MDNNLLQIKIKQRLNKLASNDYDNIECWKIAEAFNKAQLEKVRRFIDPADPRVAGDEQTLRRVDDLQILLTPKDLAGSSKSVFFESEKLPKDYLAFKRVSLKGSTEVCTDRAFKVYLAEEADADILLSDELSKPSFEWGETFCTLFGNKVRIYTNGAFAVQKPVLIYYRKPLPVQFKDCVDPSTGLIFTQDQHCEFKDDIAELIVDEAASILAGDVESMAQFQRGTFNADRNN
jgi:hypothetical protein